MSNTEKELAGLPVPAHHVPPPSTVSEQARAFLSQKMSAAPEPDINDKAAWRDHIAAGNSFLTEIMAAAAAPFPAEIITHQVGEIPVYEIVPESLNPAFEHCAILYCHGGAYIHGSGMAGAYMGQPLASYSQMRMFAVDYRMPPDHPFPVGLNDTVAAYRWLLDRFQAAHIGVAGGSAGGGLAAAFVLKARDMGLPMPGAAILATPEAHLTQSGDSFNANRYVDPVLVGSLDASIALYADGHDLTDPYLSPIFGDFSKGFSPTLLNCGTRDVFLSNTVLFHRALLKAGIEAELHVWEAMPHGGFFGSPEDQEVFAQQAIFLKKRLGSIN